MPFDGGYTVWVHEAFGPFWGFMEGFWKWTGGVVDNALYPVLMWNYFVMATGVVVQPGLAWLIKASVATILTGVQLCGLEIVGTTAIVVNVLVLAPFVMLLIVGAGQMDAGNWGDSSRLHPAGLIQTALWNFGGFENVSTIAGSTANPSKTIPRAIMFSTILITLNYLIPVMAATALDDKWADYKIGYYAKVAGAAGGEWLKIIFLASATLSGVGMFLSEMTSDCYNLMAMGEDGLVPQVFAKKTPMSGTPFVAILCGYVVIMVLIACPFGIILEVDNWLYTMALLLEFAAFLQLRISKPDMPRPFRVKGGTAAAVILVSVPSALGIFAVSLCRWEVHLVGGLVIVCGVILFYSMAYAKQKSWFSFHVYVPVDERAVTAIDQDEDNKYCT